VRLEIHGIFPSVDAKFTDADGVVYYCNRSLLEITLQRRRLLIGSRHCNYNHKRLKMNMDLVGNPFY